MREYLLKLFKYNQWANAKLIDYVAAYDGKENEIIKKLSHVINAEYVWLSRVTGNKELDREVWAVCEIKELAELSARSHELWLKFIEGMEESPKDQMIDYVNMKGQFYTNSVEDILAHVVNHGTYHRAQVNLLLKQYNHIPPNLDYINFIRYQ